jgi:hypothetical protein
LLRLAPVLELFIMLWPLNRNRGQPSAKTSLWEPFASDNWYRKRLQDATNRVQ